MRRMAARRALSRTRSRPFLDIDHSHSHVVRSAVGTHGALQGLTGQVRASGHLRRERGFPEPAVVSVGEDAVGRGLTAGCPGAASCAPTSGLASSKSPVQGSRPDPPDALALQT
jgi:hypothetical protein